MKKRFSTTAIIMASMISFIIAVLASASVFISKYGGMDVFPFATKFAAVFNAIGNSYVGDADMEAVSDAAYAAMVDSIDDRWSHYMSTEQYESYKQYQKNSYTGIGVTIEADDSGFFRISGVLEDSPAQTAGVKIGDIMCAIDDTDLNGLAMSDVKALITERQGEMFKLHLRGEDGVERTVEVASSVIFSNPVKYELMDDGIGYIKIKNFEGECANGVISAVDELMGKGAVGIVFDVRNNPGGLLSELIKVLDYLLPEGDIFISRDEDGNETIKTSDAECVDIPMAVLVNQDSYSAAEFFAAALSEYDRAAVVGIRTTGKARSQINIELSDGSAVHLSTNSYLTPNRVDLAETGGLVPDVEIGIEEEDAAYLAAGELSHEKDQQLLGAIKSLKEQIDK